VKMDSPARAPVGSRAMPRGLDHIVHAVHDLDAAADAYARLGFTVGARNRHPWGTPNRIVQLFGSFIEILTIAEPEKLGGQNEAPTPMEYIVGALNGCLGVVIELVAREQRLQLDKLEISSAGIVDQRGLFGSANVSPHFQSVEVNVEMATDADEAQLAAFQETVLKRCPVYNLIRDSGAEITVNWNKAG